MVKRWWALILALVLTGFAVKRFIDNDFTEGPLGTGETWVTILLPLLFYYLAFKRRRGRK